MAYMAWMACMVYMAFMVYITWSCITCHFDFQLKSSQIDLKTATNTHNVKEAKHTKTPSEKRKNIKTLCKMDALWQTI